MLPYIYYSGEFGGIKLVVRDLFLQSRRNPLRPGEEDSSLMLLVSYRQVSPSSTVFFDRPYLQLLF